MAVNPATVPTLSRFQQENVGTTQTGLSGILPFQHKKLSLPDAPVSSPLTPSAVIGSHFHLFSGPRKLQVNVRNRALY